MAFTLDKRHYCLTLRKALRHRILLDLHGCDNFEGFVHDTLALPQHHYLIDYLGMWSPFFRQV